jgi:hypothetical protein
MISRHFVGTTSFTIASVYGFPAGPTWPRSRELTEQLLQPLTKEVVIGATGCRIIQGDFNQTVGSLDAFQIWRHYGWVEAQCLAQHHWGRCISATCKNATTVDLMWLSPEAATLCMQVGTLDVFMEHQTVFADFHLPARPMQISRWPQPSQIDWDQVDLPAWRASLIHPPGPSHMTGAADDFYAAWATHWETALDGHVQDQPRRQLPRRCRGRASRTRPCKMPLTTPVAKPSRQGEVQLRSNFLSLATHKWFKQLRRLQSFKHAAQANKATVDAETYRLLLWQAIKQASGFHMDFPSWWRQRPHKTPTAPHELPEAPPAAALAEAIFSDFKLHFDKFESWQIRQKGRLLQQKYDASCQALFKDLRDPGRGQLDFLWDTQTYAVLDFCLETKQIHLDRPVSLTSSVKWFHQQHPFEPQSIDNDLLTVTAMPANLEIGDELTMHHYFTSLEEIHQAMQALWQPRWQKLSTIGSTDWTRIMGFIQAYLPRRHFPALTLEPQIWQQTLKRFPKHAARGVDGISVSDLQHLPEEVTQNLLTFLDSIGHNQQTWPSAMLFGKVISLAKREDSHLPAHFRPVVILSCVYRAWSRMQAFPLIQRLAQEVPNQAHGFLPGRECAQVWTHLQGYIELCLQQRLDFCGFSTDLEKCFNNIDRDVLFTLAQHVGFPASLLHAWRSFLDTFERAFEVRTALSTGLRSSQGLPEGCSLSVVGMILVDWAYHVYMKLLTPSVHVFSYVDNLTAAGFRPLQVVSALFSTMGFFKLWGLSLDLDKSYVWGLTPQCRQIMAYLGLSLKQDVLELGGNMCFGRPRRNRLLKARALLLTGKWAKLRRSRAPAAQKVAILPASFWAVALHGVAICPVPDGHLHDLRQSANKALKWNQAGSNAMLRFALQPNMMADPGFYHVMLVLTTFQRICRGSHTLLACWRWWFQSFQGDLQQGPFSVLLTTLTSVGWELVDPPWIRDHLGGDHDFLLLSGPLMKQLIQDAWLLKVAQNVHHRPTMAGLTGIDRHVTVETNATLTAHQLSLQMALQSGTFIDTWSHSKYDKSKQGYCQVCDCPNTHQHLLVCSKYQHLREQFSLTSAELTSWPPCFAHHLLCPRSPFVDALRAYFLNLPDKSNIFDSGPEADEVNHLFTDGSCCAHGRRETHVEAWAVYNATTQRPLGTGPVPGLEQTIGRGELSALVFALRWALHFQVKTHLWIDAKWVHDGFQQRKRHTPRHIVPVNGDLWLEVDNLLANGAAHLVDSSWIPSHLDLARCESPFEEWIARNNAAVDFMAVRCNHERPQSLWTLVNQQRDWDQCWRDRLQKLRHYYFHIYEITHQPPSASEVIPVVSSDEEENEGSLYSFADVLSGASDFCTFQATTGFPFSFLQNLMSWIHDHDDCEEVPRPVSLLEVTVGLLHFDPIHFPHRNPTTGEWTDQDRLLLFERPTLAYYLGIVQKTFQYLATQFRSLDPILRSINCLNLGVHIPQKGIFLRLPRALRSDINMMLGGFTRTRPVRRSADLARPL